MPSSSDDYSSLVSTARTVFLSGRSKDVEWRRGQLKGMLTLLEDNTDKLAEALFKDLRKPRQEAVTMEIEYMANVVRSALFSLDDWVKDEHVEKNILTLMDTTYIHRDPYGVSLVMGAWNYPLQLTFLPAVGALAAGNAVVLKPSELAPNTAEAIAELVPKYMDQDLVKVVLGGVPETTELLKQQFDYIFFTGSTSVGRIVSQAAARNLTPCTLELGGKCPVYLDDSVDLPVAAKRILWGKMSNLGQTCVAPDYVLCSEEMRDRLVAEMKKAYALFYAEKKGESSSSSLLSKESPDVCRIIDERNFDRLVKMLEASQATVETGGLDTADRSDLFLDLTLLTDVKDGDAVMEEEIFGPIMPIVTVQNVDGAIDKINSGEKPLSMYIFSTDKSVQERLISRTSSGSVCCNDVIVQLTVETLPFGGVGKSGHGSCHGRYTYKTFSHEKSVLVRDFNFVGEQLGISRYPPYSQSKIDRLSLLVRARKMPAVGGALKVLLLLALGALSLVALKAAARAADWDTPEWM